MPEENEFLSYAARVNGVSEESDTSVMDEPTEETTEAQTEQTTEMGSANEGGATTETPTETPTEPTGEDKETTEDDQPAPDYGKLLAELTEGKIADVDTFKAEIGKLSEYEELKKKIAENEQNKVTFANDWIKTLNELVAGGKGKDQIESFIRLNQIGSLEELNPNDAKVAKLVLVDGYSEKAAKALVKREFDLESKIEEFGEDSEEVELLKEELRVSSKKDLEALQEYRKELTTIESPTEKINEQQKLADEVHQKQFVSFIEKESPKIATFFPQSEKVEAKVKLSENGEDIPVEFDYKYPKDFLETQLPKIVNDFLMESGEANQANIKEAFNYAKAIYWSNDDNLKARDAIVASKVAAKIAEAKDNEYSNISGLPNKDVPPVTQSTTKDQYKDFLKSMVG